LKSPKEQKQKAIKMISDLPLTSARVERGAKSVLPHPYSDRSTGRRRTPFRQLSSLINIIEGFIRGNDLGASKYRPGSDLLPSQFPVGNADPFERLAGEMGFIGLWDLGKALEVERWRHGRLRFGLAKLVFPWLDRLLVGLEGYTLTLP
jgi:hypothetical protein